MMRREYSSVNILYNIDRSESTDYDGNTRQYFLTLGRAHSHSSTERIRCDLSTVYMYTQYISVQQRELFTTRGSVIKPQIRPLPTTKKNPCRGSTKRNFKL